MRSCSARLKPSRSIEGDVEARDEALAMSFLEIQIAEHESLHFQRGNPSLAIGEVAFGAISLMTRPFAAIEERAAAAAARLVATRRLLAGARQAITDGVPGEWRTKCLRECEGAVLLLTRGVPAWIEVESIPAPLARRLSESATAAAGAVDEFRRWLEREASAAPEHRYACGPDFFDL